MCGDDDNNFAEYGKPMREARARVYEDTQKRTLDEKDRAAAEARAAALKATQRSEYATALDNSYKRALGAADANFSSRGLDFNQYRDEFTGALERQKLAINPDADPRSYFDDNFVNSTINNMRDNKRMMYGRQVDNIFGDDFSKKTIGDDFDDSALGDIYNEQYGEANDTLQRAIARGNLSPIGASLAKQKLEAQGKAGMSRLQDLGSGVLGRYRGELNEFGNQARTKAGGYNLGDTFDPEGYKAQLGDKTKEFGTRLRGDLADATKGEQLFNVDEVVGKAGVAQGVYNPASNPANVGASPIMSALGARKKRNTSSAGAF